MIKKVTTKKAISLIVLVITIIIMIILAGAIIVTLTNQGIIEKAEKVVDDSDMSEVKSLAELKWSYAYIAGKKTKAELEQAVIEEMEKALGKEITDKYLFVINDEGVDVYDSTYLASVIDNVPIPKGFVASSVEGENTRAGGLVIYEGTEPVTDKNQYEALRTRNQYVWVPIAKNDFTTKFVRGAVSNTTLSNKLGEDIWEVVLNTTTNMPLLTQDVQYMSETTLAEVQAMYKSVKEYNGFYIARYETGIDTQRTAKGNAKDLPGIKAETEVYSVMGKIPYTYIPWTWNNSMSEDTNGAVDVARRMYPNDNANTTGVVSTLTYGVQWDSTLKWWSDTNAVASIDDSTEYGNYINHEIKLGDLNSGAKYATYGTTLSSYANVEYNSDEVSTTTKSSSQKYALTTGALKAAKVNNIYDMAGNMYEWTMEGISSDSNVGRLARGGDFDDNGSKNDVEVRGFGTSNGSNWNFGFRVCLYVK